MPPAHLNPPTPCANKAKPIDCLFNLIRQRESLLKAVTAYKYTHNAPIYDAIQMMLITTVNPVFALADSMLLLASSTVFNGMASIALVTCENTRCSIGFHHGELDVDLKDLFFQLVHTFMYCRSSTT